MKNHFYINHDFAKLWLQATFRILSERFRELVIPLIVLGLTSSPLITALVLLSQQLGTILFSIPIGTIIEERNPRRIVFCCNVIQAGLIFGLAYSINSEGLQPLHIANLLFLVGMVSLIHNTAFQRMVPSIAGRERLLSAHTFLEGADAVVTLVGPALGGYLLARYGADITLVLCSVFLIMSAGFMWVLRYNHKKPEPKDTKRSMREMFSSFFGEAREGILYLKANQAQKASTIAACSLSFATVFVVLSVIFHAGAILQLSEVEIGVILSFAGVGNILGVLLMNRFKRVHWLYFMSALIIISSLGVLLLLSNNIAIMCIGMLLFDGALSMAFVVQLTVQQGITPDRLLTRVRSAVYVIGAIASILATFLAGALTEFNSHLALLFGSLMLMVPAFYLYRYKESSVPMHKLKPMDMNEDI